MTHIIVHHAKPPGEILARLRCQSSAARVASAGGRDGSFAPAFEIREYLDQFTVKADVPGVRSSDLSIYLDNGWLIVVGRRPSDEELIPLEYCAYERTFGSFWRAFRLAPSLAAPVRATLRSGVLTVVLPKQPTRVPGSCFLEVTHRSANFDSVPPPPSGHARHAPMARALRVAGARAPEPDA